MALSQPGSAVEWWVFILMQCDPQTPSHSHSHWASRQSEAYFGLMCCQAPSLRFLRPPRHRGDPPSLPPARLPLPRFVFLPRFVTLVVCQTKRAPFPFLVFFWFFFSAWRCWSGSRVSSVGPHYAERFPSGSKARATLGRLPSHQERLSRRRRLLPHLALLFLHHLHPPAPIVSVVYTVVQPLSRVSEFGVFIIVNK